jgi:hypothetical protein
MLVTGFPGHDRHNKTARIGQLLKDSSNTTTRTGQPTREGADWDRQAEQEKQDRSAMIQGQNYQDRTSRARTAKTGQADKQKKTRILGKNNRTGLLGKDGLDRTVKTG